MGSLATAALERFVLTHRVIMFRALNCSGMDCLVMAQGISLPHFHCCRIDIALTSQYSFFHFKLYAEPALD